MAVKKILIVEDNIDYAHIIKENLMEGLGYCEINILEDGDQAEEYFIEGGNADFVITDLRMPSLEGIALAESILKRHPQMCIILISAFLSLEDKERALSLGVQYVFEKPLDFSKLLDVLNRLGAFFLRLLLKYLRIPRAIPLA